MGRETTVPMHVSHCKNISEWQCSDGIALVLLENIRIYLIKPKQTGEREEEELRRAEPLSVI